MPDKQLGPYEIGRKLGRGGMGTVYAAVDTATGQSVALKVLAPILASETGFRERFELEIESLKKLRHPGIVRLLAYGEQNDRLFYAMELVMGTNLDREIRSGRRYTWREAADFAIHLCAALKHAHDRGVVHRDIKPANLLITYCGDYKLSDFGIARLFGATRLTGVGGVLGTAEYMAPEQVEGRSITPECDLYSMGGVLYAMLTGRAPFEAKTLPQMLHMQKYAEPDPVRRYAPEIPPQLDDLILKLLAKSPADRFPNVGVLSRHLEAMARGITRLEEEQAFFLATSRSGADDSTKVNPLAETRLAVAAPDDLKLVDESSSPAEVRPAHSRPPNLLTDDSSQKPKRKVERFTRVGDSPAADAAAEESADPAWTLHTLLLAIGLLIVIGIGWYLLRPDSADTLYTTITGTADSDDRSQFLAAADDAQEFIRRFPDDPRNAEVRRYLDEFFLLNHESRLRRLSRGLLSRTKLTPVERAYLLAIHDLYTAPATALAKLKSFVAIYELAAEREDKKARLIVELARRKIDGIEKDLNNWVPRQLAELQSHMDRADKLAESDLGSARMIWEGIVELYANAPWAADILAVASQRLHESENSATMAKFDTRSEN